MVIVGQEAMEKSIEILWTLYEKEIIPDKCQNERYLHHYYSKEIQKTYDINFGNLRESKLHPEWPTNKKVTKNDYSKYKKIGNNYIVAVDGSSGFIDFAIGEYKKPEFAIEFTSKYGFGKDELAFDFLKLLDLKNPFKNVISFNLIYREKGLSQGKRKENLKEALNIAFSVINNRSRSIDYARQYIFWIVEIDAKGKKRSWIRKNNTDDWNCYEGEGISINDLL